MARSVRVSSKAPIPKKRKGKKGYWFRYYDPATGKQKAICSPTYELALRAAHEAHQERLRASLNESTNPDDKTLEVFFNKFLEYRRPPSPAAVTPPVFKSYEQQIQTFLTFMRDRYPIVNYIGELTEEMMLEYSLWLSQNLKGRKGEPAKNQTRLLYFNVVANAIHWGIKTVKWLKVDVSQSIDRPKPKVDAVKSRAYSPEELEAILLQLNGPERTVLEAYAFTGARYMELQNVRRYDIHLDARVKWFRIESRPGARTKNLRSREIPIKARLVHRIQARLDQGLEYPFRRDDGTIWPKHMLRRRLRAAAKAAQIQDWDKIKLHEMRHTFLTIAGENADPRSLMEISGHSGSEMLDRYCHPRMEAKAAIIEKMAG